MTLPRRSTIYLSLTAGLLLVLGGIFLSAAVEVAGSAPRHSRSGVLVRQLELTDLCIFTEASYTRHPALSDPSTPFQDAPLSMEHFPSGALLGPPPHLVRDHVQQD